MIKKTVVYMLDKTKMTMPTSKPLFYEFTTRKKYGVPSQNFVKKNALCEKGDEITRFDGI
jgi:hypothetical protein